VRYPFFLGSIIRRIQCGQTPAAQFRRLRSIFAQALKYLRQGQDFFKVDLLKAIAQAQAIAIESDPTRSGFENIFYKREWD
jgi:hypothetical protein